MIRIWPLQCQYGVPNGNSNNSGARAMIRIWPLQYQCRAPSSVPAHSTARIGR
jgi:hypothetical protein